MYFLRSIRILHQVISLLLVMTILNVSIDPPDLLRNLDNDLALEEDVSINEMESISEVLLEKVFGMHNVVPETDDEDHETYLKKVEIVHMHYDLSYPELIVEFLTTPVQNTFPFSLREQTSLHITSPPPWA